MLLGNTVFRVQTKSKSILFIHFYRRIRVSENFIKANYCRKYSNHIFYKISLSRLPAEPISKIKNG